MYFNSSSCSIGAAVVVTRQVLLKMSAAVEFRDDWKQEPIHRS